MEDTVVQVGPKPSHEIQKLIRKYKGGRIPPLIKEEGDPNEDGLLNGDFLTIYRTGIGHWGSSIFNLTPGGLLNQPGTASVVTWDKENAKYIEDEMVKTSWHGFCRRFREAGGTACCQRCDREFAAIVANDVVLKKGVDGNGGAIAYLCHAGLIDLAMPVVVEGKPIAVFFSGQCWPASCDRWNPEITLERGTFRLLGERETGVDASKVAQRRLDGARDRMKQLHGVDLPHPTDKPEQAPGTVTGPAKAQYSPSIVLTPHELRAALDTFQKAADYLSRFAGQTASLEKTRVTAWLRGEIGRTLTLLKELPPGGIYNSAIRARIMDTELAWVHLEGCLAIIGDYFGCDSVVLFRCVPSERQLFLSMWTQGQGLKKIGPIRVFRSQERELRKHLSARESLSEIPASVLSPWGEARRALRNQGIREDTSGLYQSQLLFPGSSWAGIAVWKRPRARRVLDELLTPCDKEALGDVLHDVTAVAGTLLSLEEKDALLESQELFLEGMAHDIRNPIQAILFSVAAIDKGAWNTDELKQRVRSIGTSVRRVFNISNRVWFDRLIQRGKAPFADTSRVVVYDAISNCCKLVEDHAQKQGIQIRLDESMNPEVTIKVNLESFLQVVHNLLDNAVKYSDKDTCVRVSCVESDRETELRFSNRGVFIPEEEKDRIFDRYYRSKSAEVKVRQGTGIGLAIVKAFADHYGSIRVESTLLKEGCANTEFILTITKDIWRGAASFLGR